MGDLRRQLIRLAYENRDLRSVLVPLLKEGSVLDSLTAREKVLLADLRKSRGGIESFIMDAYERRVANKLVRKGLVARGAFEGDARNNIYYLTLEGEEAASYLP